MIEGPPFLPAREEAEPRRRAVGNGRVTRVSVEQVLRHPPVDLSADSVELLREFERTGRPDVFEAFMRRHASMVYATCLKVTRDPHDAEDATQATFLTLASKAHLSADIRQPEAWLRKVAHRLSLDLIRSKKRRINRENLRSEMTTEEAPLDSHDHADRGEVKGILNEELQKLPASYRMPLILHYFGGLSRDEMAAQLKLKPSTLGVRLHRAREQLRKRLANRGVALPAVAVTALLTEAVRQSVCASIIPGTAAKASAIALGQSAPSSFGISASVAGGTAGFGSIRSILAVMMASKFKFSIVALVLGTAISMTSAQVRSLIPEVLRSLIPALRTPSLPKIDLHVDIPTLTASNDEPMPAVLAPINIPGYARTKTPAVATAAASVPLPPINRPAVTPVAVASNAVPMTIPPRPSVDRSAVAASLDLNRAVINANRHADIVAGTASTRTLTPLATATPRPPVRAQQQSAAPEPVATPMASAAAFSTIGSVLPTSNLGIPGIAVPDAVATASSHLTETPSHAGSDVTGPVPSLPRASGSSTSTSSSSTNGSDGVVLASAGSGGGSTTSHVTRSVSGSSTGSSSGVPTSGGSSNDGLHVTVVDVPHTAVFTGVASNYGGYSDQSWKPTELTDMTGAIGHVQAPPVTASFEMASPAIPGESLSINGARVTVHGTGADAATPTISFVDTTGEGVPAFPQGHTFFGVWKLEHDEAFSSADLLVRYDDLRAARLGLFEQNFKLWVSDGNGWELLWKDPTFGRDAEKNLLWVTAGHDFKYFAVSSPEPATLVAVLGLSGVLGIRRRRRRV